MSTFLQLVQELHEQTGGAGLPPASTIGQTGEAARFVRWVKQSDDFVKDLWINWKFLHTTYSQTTVGGQAKLPVPADLATWDIETFKITPINTTIPVPLCAVEYETVKSRALDATQGLPHSAIVMPDNSLTFEQVPDNAHTITADYYKTPVQLKNNIDESEIPAQFHQVIIGRALMLYGNFENAPEIKRQGEEIYGEFLSRLENHQLPNQNYSRYRTGGGFQVTPY